MTTDIPPPATATATTLQDSLNNNNAEDSANFKTPQPRRMNQKPGFNKDRVTFYNELIHFHDKIGTPITRFPKLSGREIDLHTLYSCVIGKGGWMKVNLKDEWDEVLADIKIPNHCVNIAIAIKQIYIRYLDRYEKVYFLGESLDRADDEEDESEKMHVKKLSSRTLHAIPQTYNHSQHYLSEATRIQHKLPVIKKKSSEYDKLLLSLMSPLPNEQDFAINVCTLMSNEGRHMLKLEKCPKLLNTLMAHAGIFTNTNIREVFTEFYSNIRKHSLESFWKDCLYDKKQYLELAYEDIFKTAEVDEHSLNDILVARDTLQLTGESENMETLVKKLNLNADLEQLDFLSLSRGLGTHDYIGQRVHQISTILRNLSFIEENVFMLSRNRSFLRFLIMLSNVRWGNLHHMGLDMLGNVASEIELADPTSDHLTRCLMSTVIEGLECVDRGIIISCLEILSKISQKECNEDFLHKCLNKKIYGQICVFLCLNDIMLLLYTLECIYSLSSLGEKACNQIMQVQGIIDTLVSLVTVEAQSYGPDACILMRVVETIPGHISSHQKLGHVTHSATSSHTVTQQLNIQNEPISSIPATITMQPAIEPPKLPMAAPPAGSQIATSAPPPVSQAQILQSMQNTVLRPPTIGSPAATTIDLNVTTPQKPQTTAPVVSTETTSQTQTTQSITTQVSSLLSPNSVSAQHAHQQLIQENEQFASAWLRAIVEPAANLSSTIEQQELYKMYMQASTKIGRRGVLSPLHFPRIVRTVFGGTVGPNPIKNDGHLYYEGIKLRASPLPVVQKTIVTTTLSTVTSTVISISSPSTTAPCKPSINHALMAPTTKTEVTNAPSQVVKVATSTPILNQALTSVNTIVTPPQPQNASQIKQVIVQQPTTKSNSLLVAQLCGKNIILNKSTPSTSPLLQQVLQSTNPGEKNIIVVQQPTNQPQPGQIQIVTPNANPNNLASNQLQIVASNSPNAQVTAAGSTSMHIRNLLANKVTPNTDVSNVSNASPTVVKAAASNLSTCLIAPNVNVHQVTQRQLQKQKLDQIGVQNASVNNTSIVVNANNPNNPTNIKLGNSTISIKPGTLPNNTVITATNPHEKTIDVRQLATSNNPPPLAPLSSTIIKPVVPMAKIEDVDSTLIPAHIIKKGDKLIKIDPTDINSNNGNQKLSANKMLADLLEKKSDPPSFEVSVKRKIDGVTDANESQPMAKRQENGEIMPGDMKTNGEEKPCKKAADLYAELAGSILEDEDLEEIPPQIKTEPKLMMTLPKQQISSPVQNAAKQQVITVPVPLQQRQILMSPNQQGQMLLSPGGQNNPPQLSTQTTATIKTESGYQTVPIILQHQGGGMQKSSVLSNSGQNQTQYILATNQQGQTVMVPAQTNPHPIQQTVLLAQTPQQHGTGAKTIIILQQPGGQVSAIAANQQTTQKVLMTTPQGQQLLVTQMPRQQIIVNQQSSGQATLTTNSIITSAQTQSGQKIFITKNAAGEIELQKQPTVGQIGGQQVILHPTPKEQTQPGQIIFQQTPGGGQQVLNIVQTQQGNRPGQQQIVIQAQPPTQSQIQTHTTTSSTGNHQIVIQKQPVQNMANQLPVTAQLPPQIQVQTKTVVVKQPAPTPQQSIVNEEKSESVINSTSTLSSSLSNSSETSTNGTNSPGNLPPQPSPIHTQNSTNSIPSTTSATSSNATTTPGVTTTTTAAGQQMIQMIPAMDPSKIVEEDVEASWLWVCDWRGCPKKKFQSANEVYLHACAVHCPDNIDPSADIYCQWGPGPGLCDNLPRKRFSLMTHIFDRHCMPDSFRAAAQRRMTNPNADTPKQPYPVTLIRQPNAGGSSGNETDNKNGSGPGQVQNAGTAALQAIKRHTIDFPASKELTSNAIQGVLGTLLSCTNSTPTFGGDASTPVNSASNTNAATTSTSITTMSSVATTQSVTTTVVSNQTLNSSTTQSTNIGGGILFPRDDNEGPVTKSIRLTSALILRNLVNYSALAKRNLRHYEPHLAGVALSNVESSRTIAQVLYDMNETHPV